MTEQSPKIFVIEDDPMLREIFVDVFERHGYVVECAPEGRTALARLKDIQPELILLDLHLPEISGQAVLKQIKEQPHLANTRVVLLTADGIRAKALENQVDEVILKPVAFDTLLKLAKGPSGLP